VTWLGSGWIVAIVVTVTAVVLVRAQHGLLAGIVIAVPVVTALVVRALKELVDRHRPPPVTHLVDASGAAFPSGHAAQAVACFGAIVLVLGCAGASRRVVGVAAVIGGLAVVGVGWSRVVLGVHWPSDVLGGWLVGGIVVLVATTALLGLRRSRDAQ